MSIEAQSILNAVRQVAGEGEDIVPLHAPEFKGREWEYIKECLDTGWVSSVGSYVDDFGKNIAEKCGVSYAIPVVNGTAALHIALKLAGVKSGDEVLVPGLTFVATANAVSYCGAIPHFVDSAPDTLGIDPEKLATYLGKIADGPVNKNTGRKIAAIIPVHIFGHPVDMDALNELAEQYGIPVIEDAAEALGSLYRNRKAGSLAKMAALSFNGNKIITTGGGGAILTDDQALAEHAKHLTTTAKEPHRWAFNHDEVGYNYRMPNINAALGCAQLEKLEGYVGAKRKLAEKYERAFADLNNVSFFREPEFAVSNYWLNAVLLDRDVAGDRNNVLAALNDAGYQCRPAWTLMHKLPMYQDCLRMDMTVAEDIEARLINLPSSANLGDAA